jgi:hypothetical protein
MWGLTQYTIDLPAKCLKGGLRGRISSGVVFMMKTILSVS